MNKLNKEQQSVVDSNSSKILVLAGAGAGKTHTMLERIDRLVKEGTPATRILVLTFTNAAAFEMRERYKSNHSSKITPEFKTFHSFCYHLLIIDKSIRDYLGYSEVPKVISESELKKVETTAKMQCNLKLSEDKISGKVSCSLREQQQLDLYRKAVKRLLKTGNMITFDILAKEVSELFTSNNSLADKYKSKYNYIFVDEFQDTDPSQVRFLSSFKNSNFCFIGDCLQCQPAGTKVRMSDLSEKNIEDIQVGDNVVGCVQKDGRFRKSCKVTDVESHISEDIVEVKSANHSSRYSKEHITYAKIHLEGNEDKRCVYLMCNDKGWWRIGECSLYLYSGKDFGPKYRMHEEGCSKVWILKVCDNSREASWYEEQFAAFKFGIPDTTFQFDNIYRYTGETMQMLYDSIPDIEDRAMKCLEYYGLDIRYPFFNKYTDASKHMSKLHIFPLYVGNLIPGIMDIAVPVPHEERYRLYKLEYEQILEVSECEPETVYSLEVDFTHNYIADGVLTHNCIYQFRGCTNDFIKLLAKDETWDRIKLYQNYRSTNQICNFANNMSKYADAEYRIEMKGQRDGDAVEVIYGAYSDWKHVVCESHCSILLDRLRQHNNGNDVAVLCRTNNEVRYICQLLKDNGILYSSGKRNEDALHILKSVQDDDYMLDWLSSFLSADKYAEYIRAAAQEENPDIRWFSKEYGNYPEIKSRGKVIVDIRKVLRKSTNIVSKAADILNLLGIKGIVEDIESEEDIIPGLISIISNQGDQDIYVGTIHSSKGLEYDTVYIMGVDDKSFKLLSEEMNNLYYVGLTRAKNHLVVFRR